MSDRTYDVEVIAGAEGRCLAIGLTGSSGSTRIAGPKPWGGGSVEQRFVVDEDRLLEALADDRGALVTLRGRAVDCLARRRYAASKLEEGSEERIREEGVVAAWEQMIDFIDAQEALRTQTKEDTDGRPE